MMGNYFGHMGGFGFMPGFGIFGLFFMLIFWALVIWAAVALVRGASGHGCGHWFGHDEPKEKKDNATGILKERYAKGEIGKDEFEKMKKDLE
jgi:putative membrane protein